MGNITKIFLLVLGLIGTTSCGGVGPGGESGGGTAAGAAAPPISLPAPVTGRLTITSPDENGTSLVIGDDGSVPADSIVHAVNSTQATTSTLSLAGLSAETTLPSLCSQSFHACTIADSAGSFELEIQAADSDEIGVEILDPTAGTPISERITQDVPRNIRNFVRPVLDVALLHNTSTADRNLYALMGSTTDDPYGRIAVVDLATETRRIFSFAGTRPDRMTVCPEKMLGAIVDSESNLLTVVDLVSENFDAPSIVLSVPRPRDVLFTSDGNSLILATTSSPFLLKFDPMTGDLLAALGDANLADKLPEATNISTLALDLTLFTNGGFTADLVAFAGIYDVRGTRTPAVGLLDPFGGILGVTALPAGAEPMDVAFYQTQDRLLVTDVVNNKIWIYSYSSGSPSLPTDATLTLEGEVADPFGMVADPRNITVDPASGLAFVNAKNGTETKPDTVLTVDLVSESIVDANPVGLGPTGLVFDPIDNLLYISTFKTHSITFWGLTDLRP